MLVTLDFPRLLTTPVCGTLSLHTCFRIMKIELILLCCIVLLINICECTNDEYHIRANKEARLLVGAYSTRTYISLTTLSSTVPSTCFNGLNAVPCRKRRSRKSKVLNNDFETNTHEFGNLSSSLGIKENPMNIKAGNREGRLKITFWSTVTSSFTLITTVVNTATVQSVSYFCSLPGYSFPPTCG